MKKKLTFLSTLTMLLTLPVTVQAQPNFDNYSPGIHVFQRVTCKEDITGNSRYIIAGITTDKNSEHHNDIYVMCPGSDVFYNYHYATTEVSGNSDYIYMLLCIL